MDIRETTRKIFQKYLSPRIPKKQTNVFYMLFHGFDEMASYLESLIKFTRKQQNILTANEISSLRTLAAKNGFEPQLKMPASGKLRINANASIFSRTGFPLYIPPFCQFTDVDSNIVYYHDSASIVEIRSNEIFIPVKQGYIEEIKHVVINEKIDKVYLENDYLGHGSINIYSESTKTYFTEVKSFSDSVNVNDNKQFLVKFSNKPNQPIVIYIKGGDLNDTLNIQYRICHGEAGNINGSTIFTSDSILDINGLPIDFDENEIEIVNDTGFNLGSNGSDINLLKSAIGFNHGVTMLFDTISYGNFIKSFSIIYLQKILIDDENKQIKHLYIGRKLFTNLTEKLLNNEYNNIVNNKKYLLSEKEQTELVKNIEENEFALSSHTFNQLLVKKYAIQITFQETSDLIFYRNSIENLIYSEFFKFLYDYGHSINFELLFSEFMKENNIKFTYLLLSENSEISFIQNQNYLIDAKNNLPLLTSNFNIISSSGEHTKIFDNIIFNVKN